MTRAAAGAVIAALALTACGRAPDAVRIAGTVEIHEVRLAPLASGRLLRLLKDEGDTVRRGDTVAVLDQPGLAALVAQRRAQAEGAAARTAQVDAAVADSVRAAGELARARPLRAQGIVSAEQYDRLAAAAAAAAATVAAVRAAPAEAAAARAGLAQALELQSELTLVAPADGIVLTRYAEPGEVVAAGTPVVTIGEVARPWIRAYVAEPLVGRLKIGAPARVFTDAYPGRAFAGTVIEIAPRAEYTPRVALTERERADLVFAIKLRVTDDGGRLKAGMPVTITLPLAP